jgi:hypothetical protein
MKRIISFVLVIVFLTTAIVYVSGQSEFKEYKSIFIEFQYPVEWESVMTEGLEAEGIHTPKDNRISFEIPNTKGAFTILIKDMDKKNLEELLQEEIQSYEESESLWGYKEEILEITDVTLSNEPAKKIIVYQEEYDKKISQIVSLHDNKRYSILYRMDPASFDNYIPTIEKMIQSIKFTK